MQPLSENDRRFTESDLRDKETKARFCELYWSRDWKA